MIKCLLLPLCNFFPFYLQLVHALHNYLSCYITQVTTPFLLSLGMLVYSFEKEVQNWFPDEYSAYASIGRAFAGVVSQLRFSTTGYKH